MQRKTAAICIVAGLLSFFTAGPSRAITWCTLSNGGARQCHSCRDSKCHEVKVAPRLERRGTLSMKVAVHQLQNRDPMDGQIPTPLGRFGGTEKERKIFRPADVSLLQYGTPISGNISSPLTSSYGCINVEMECWQNSIYSPNSVIHGWGANYVWGISHVWGVSHVWSNNHGWGSSNKWQ